MSALKDKIDGYLEVGIDPATFEVVLNLDHDRNGVGHICFSPRQARALGRLLTKKANDADKEYTLAQGGRPDAAGGKT